MFTKENAAIYATKGNLVRWSPESRELSQAKRDAHTLAKLAMDPGEEFKLMRLMRVRKQLNRIDRMIEKETDPGKLDRLASCAIRLNEQERQLSNRSLPPTLKANSPARPRKNSGAIPDPTD